MKDNLIIGSHVGFSNTKQLLGSVEEALRYNANTFMFYTGAPQNTRRSPLSQEYTKKAYDLMHQHNINPNNVIIHAPYIVNLGNLANFDFSVTCSLFSLSIIFSSFVPHPHIKHKHNIKHNIFFIFSHS